MLDMTKMIGKMKEMESRIQETKESLEKIETVGEAGGKMVCVTINGNKKVLGVAIDSSILNKEDKTLIQDLIVAATNNAMKAADEQIKIEVAKSTDGLLPNMLGLNIGNLFK